LIQYKNKILLHFIKMSLTLSFKPSVVSAKNYVSNGYTMNNQGYLANPTHSAQVAANNAGALTRAEAASMGLGRR
jgi:hypothetical protein